MIKVVITLIIGALFLHEHQLKEKSCKPERRGGLWFLSRKRMNRDLSLSACLHLHLKPCLSISISIVNRDFSFHDDIIVFCETIHTSVHPWMVSRFTPTESVKSVGWLVVVDVLQVRKGDAFVTLLLSLSLSRYRLFLILILRCVVLCDFHSLSVIIFPLSSSSTSFHYTVCFA